MKAVVLGAGVIGVTTAYYLRRLGVEVEVLDRQPGPALETSFANAGEVSPGYASPWASPGIVFKAIRWLLMTHRPLIIGKIPDPTMVDWLVRTLGNATQKRYAVNKGRMVRLAEYSRDCLRALREETGLAYDERALGTLQLFRTEKQLDAASKDMAVLEQFGVPYQLLDAAQCRTYEPGLGHATVEIAGGLRLPGDETGDCHMFTGELEQRARGLGVDFRYDTEILSLERSGDRVTGVRTGAGLVGADVFVLAAGSYSPGLAAGLGLRLPVYPVKGYSITSTLIDEQKAPVSTVLDETYKVAITRLGGRIRVGGMAELSGYDKSLSERRRATLLHCATQLFPGSFDRNDTTFWSGLRPMTPDGTPIVGASRYRNLFLNTGHGTLGWTMACGSGRLLADLVTGRVPEIEHADLGVSRYGSR